MADKASFFSSLMAGISGFVKGTIALGIVGALVGATGGAIIGAFSAEAGAVAATAIAGAINTGAIGAMLGSTFGPIVSILQSREQGAVDGQDVVNVANMAFAQGMQAGRSKNVSEPSKEQVQHAADHFQKQLAAEKSSPAIAAR